jgi:Tfp pilus assembly protein PilV
MTARRQFPRASCSGAGFTMVELILTLVMAGVLSALFIQMMGTSLTKSGAAVGLVRDQALVEKVLETIHGDYVKLINSNAPLTALTTIKASITANTYNTDGVTVTGTYVTYASGVEQAQVSSDFLRVTATKRNAVMSALFTNQRRAITDPAVPY